MVKRSVAETVPERAFADTRNATFGTIRTPEEDYFAPFLKDQYLQRNGALVPFRTVPDQFLQRSVSLSGTVNSLRKAILSRNISQSFSLSRLQSKHNFPVCGT